MAASGKKSVLFICLGNICRSPIAEAVFAHMVKERGLTDQWTIDSAAMAGYHTGDSPDGRAIACLKGHGVSTGHKARTIKKTDFTTFDFIFGMDEENMSDLKRKSPNNPTAKVLMLGSYDPEGQLIIEDPYYGGDGGFETVYQQCTRCCKAFLDEQSQ